MRIVREVQLKQAPARHSVQNLIQHSVSDDAGAKLRSLFQVGSLYYTMAYASILNKHRSSDLFVSQSVTEMARTADVRVKRSSCFT